MSKQLFIKGAIFWILPFVCHDMMYAVCRLEIYVFDLPLSRKKLQKDNSLLSICKRIIFSKENNMMQSYVDFNLRYYFLISWIGGSRLVEMLK